VALADAPRPPAAPSLVEKPLVFRSPQNSSKLFS